MICSRTKCVNLALNLALTLKWFTATHSPGRAWVFEFLAR
ncbi:hypothetical protein BMETH_2942_1 [methanotrophic bacterial endosymbiont of Bathymodiolus sp.]|nr:hypothetical protein BMETH_2942_1 [methanotrophic bacterial endosymbiont of Bathymodiolus sp.]